MVGGLFQLPDPGFFHGGIAGLPLAAACTCVARPHLWIEKLIGPQRVNETEEIYPTRTWLSAPERNSAECHCAIRRLIERYASLIRRDEMKSS
jgi:hypothetical protein